MPLEHKRALVHNSITFVKGESINKLLNTYHNHLKSSSVPLQDLNTDNSNS